MRKVITAVFAVTMMAAASCSSSDSDGGSKTTFSCDDPKSKCPNDEPLDPATCKRIVEEPTCGDLMLQMFLCIGEHQTCLADGTTDQSVSERECSAEMSAAVRCATNFDAGGGG
jgi:hypothetical protein